MKWWLLAIPQYLIVGLFGSSGGRPIGAGRHLQMGGGLSGLLVLVALSSSASPGDTPAELFNPGHGA